MPKKMQNKAGWLFKEEPGTYNYANLENDGSTIWSGVKNALARQHLRQIQVGDRVLYYHTGTERAIVGEMQVTAVVPDPGDPKGVHVTVEPVKRWPTPVTLEEIKKEPLFADWELVRISRLSVMPVSAERWQRLEEMSKR